MVWCHEADTRCHDPTAWLVLGGLVLVQSDSSSWTAIRPCTFGRSPGQPGLVRAPSLDSRQTVLGIMKTKTGLEKGAFGGRKRGLEAQVRQKATLSRATCACQPPAPCLLRPEASEPKIAGGSLLFSCEESARCPPFTPRLAPFCRACPGPMKIGS